MIAPSGFGRAYARVASDPAEPAVLSGLLALVGYDARPSVVAGWSLDRRVQAEVYATNVHLRASDNRGLRRHPHPDWLPPPWGGSSEGESILDTPGGTVLGHSA